jgi:hypothetical protein
VTKRNYGVIASVIGSAIGAWWYVRRRQAGSAGLNRQGMRERGRVIFDNTPTAADTAVV